MEHTNTSKLEVGFIDQGLGHGHYVLARADTKEILFHEKTEGDLDFINSIVQACNAYTKDQQTIKELVEACEQVISSPSIRALLKVTVSMGIRDELNKLEQAIAKAKA